MAQTWAQDPKTGDYIMNNGVPVETDELTAPAYIRLKAKRTQWQYAPDVDWGSDFYLIKKHRTNQDASVIENVGARALQPMVDDGRSSQVTVTATVVTRNGVGMETKITDATGNVKKLVLPSLL